MLSMQLIDTIRRLEKEGMSIREINRKTGYSRNTIAKYVNGAQPGYRRTKKSHSPKKTIVSPLIEKWIIEDEKAPRKQKRTRWKMFRDLVDQYNYGGSYTTVKKVVAEIKGIRRDVFVPRHYQPGDYGEFDFGELYIDIGGKRTLMYLHAFQLPYSNDRFGYLSVRQRQEDMFESHKQAFSHFDGVPKTMRYDNLKQAVNRILKKGLREENKEFKRFREQFGYEAEFCGIGKGNEKGDVEGCVGYIRRNFFSPVIQLNDVSELDMLNTKLATWCKSLRQDKSVPGTDKVVGELFQFENNYLQSIPHRIPDVGRHTVAKANHHALISVDRNWYSVPVNHAYHLVDVLICAREIIVSVKHKEIARHKRCVLVGQSVYDPTHYIPIFKKKPYTLMNGKPLQGLPPVFGQFFTRAYHRGYRTARHCVDVLELLKTHTTHEVASAIELTMAYGIYHSEGVKNMLNQLQEDSSQIQKVTTFKRAECAEIHIPPVDLSRYDTLVKNGSTHVG